MLIYISTFIPAFKDCLLLYKKHYTNIKTQKLFNMVRIVGIAMRLYWRNAVQCSTMF